MLMPRPACGCMPVSLYCRVLEKKKDKAAPPGETGLQPYLFSTLGSCKYKGRRRCCHEGVYLQHALIGTPFPMLCSGWPWPACLLETDGCTMCSHPVCWKKTYGFLECAFFFFMWKRPCATGPSARRYPAWMPVRRVCGTHSPLAVLQARLRLYAAHSRRLAIFRPTLLAAMPALALPLGLLCGLAVPVLSALSIVPFP